MSLAERLAQRKVLADAAERNRGSGRTTGPLAEIRRRVGVRIGARHRGTFGRVRPRIAFLG